MPGKTPKKNQVYDNYWSFTLGFTDWHEEKSIVTLRTMVEFIDNEMNGRDLVVMAQADRVRLYKLLMSKINPARKAAGVEEIDAGGQKRGETGGQKRGETDAEWDKRKEFIIRKTLNHFVKLGFIEPGLTKYHDKTRQYLDTKSEGLRARIFSEIAYENSHFEDSCTEMHKKRRKHVDFFIKTLEHAKAITKSDLFALMYTKEIEKYPNGYLTREELDVQSKKAQQKTVLPLVNLKNFEKRKKVQFSHTWNLFSTGLQGITAKKIKNKDTLMFSVDADAIPDETTTRCSRDNYKHRLMKIQLQEESEDQVGEARCMVEDLPHPILVNSHIKPWRFCVDADCNELEGAYEPNNGLLLSRTLDGYFDTGNITFNADGTIKIADSLPTAVRDHLKGHKIKGCFLNDERKKFLEWHRDHNKKKFNP